MARRRLSTQILVSQLTILVATVLIGFGLFAHAEREHLDSEYRDRALAIAEVTASVPLIREAIEYGDSGGVVAATAERIRQQTGAVYVVVIDLQGRRHSHPNPALIGQRVSEPLIALDGRGHTAFNNDTLGPTANGKAPLRGPSGNLVGEVSVGIKESEVTAALHHELPTFAIYFGIALAVGAAAAYLLAWRLKRTTFGLELPEIATLLQEREAMLHGIREGVLGFDAQGRVSVVNDEARRLLGLRTAGLGQRLCDLVAPGRLRDVLAGEVPGTDETVLTDEHCLVVNRMPVALQGRTLGAVVTLRDRTELVGVMRELDNVRAFSEALRAQQHEFANRLHTVAGLIELGDRAEASSFIQEIAAASTGSEPLRARIAAPLVSALILAKQTVAAEREVSLVLTDESWLGEEPEHGAALLTIVGNLLDNAIDAAVTVPGPASVRLHLAEETSGVTVQVSDSGPGVAADAVETVFQDGYSTKSGDSVSRRGLGLALVHRVVRRSGGRVELRPGPGALFTVWLPARRSTTIGGTG